MSRAQNHGTNLDMQLQEYLLSWGPGSWYMFNHAVPRTCTSRKILLVLHVLIQQYLWLRDMLPRVSPTWGTGTLGIMSLSHMYLYLTCNTWYNFSSRVHRTMSVVNKYPWWKKVVSGIQWVHVLRLGYLITSLIHREQLSCQRQRPLFTVYESCLRDNG